MHRKDITLRVGLIKLIHTIVAMMIVLVDMTNFRRETEMWRILGIQADHEGLAEKAVKFM